MALVDGRLWGGLIYPSSSLNASYAFSTEIDRVSSDNRELAARFPKKVDLPLDITGHEWRLNLKYAVVKDDVVATLKSAMFRPLIRPQFCPSLPIPSVKNEWRCISSGTTRQALTGLSEALAGGRPPVVLITGAPGSGKEAYAGGLHYGRSEHWSGFAAKAKASEMYSIISLAEVKEKSEFRARLEQCRSKLKVERGGTIFFDESDKGSEDVRSQMLRLLEDKRYGSIDFTDVSFVIGAGRRLSQLRDEKPPDFWTRMALHIEVADPLLAASQDERRQVIEAFFRHFWWDLASIWLEGVLCGVRTAKQESAWKWETFFKANPDARDIAEKVFAVAIGTVSDKGVLTSAAEMDYVAHCFGDLLAPHLERRSLSIRGLRSCVKGIVWDLGSNMLAASRKPNKLTDEFMEASRRAAANAVGTILQVLPDDRR